MQPALATLEEKLLPVHTALLVIDMQNDFCAEGGYVHKLRGADMSSSAPLARRIMALVRAARKAGATVLWIRANYEPKYLSEQALAKQSGSGMVCCAAGSWGWQFFEVAPAPDELIVEKHSYSGFAGTELDRLLRFRGIRTLVFAGVASNVCVESTLRDGYFRGYHVVLAEDCVDSYARDLHAATLKNVKLYFGEVCRAAQVERSWSQSAA